MMNSSKHVGNAIRATAAAASRRSSSASTNKKQKLWGGRFTSGTDPEMEKFNSSLAFDARMWDVDLRGSLAYSEMLVKVGVLNDAEGVAMSTGLRALREEWEAGAVAIDPTVDEDIHSLNERRLTELIGPEVAGKLHTGRSRNDQVAVDLKLYFKDFAGDLLGDLKDLIEITTRKASTEVDLLMPGFTHLQSAQPVRWSHWLMSYAWAFKRDYLRLSSLIERSDSCPLGSGAIAGHSFFKRGDREELAAKLEFKLGPTENSMDSVSDRDLPAEFNFWAALTQTHLSRWSEDVIIYSSQQFGFVKLHDAYSTGSSLMPQKKNPDASELLRGKTARLIGNLTTSLVYLKGIPSTYNKDLQEDKEPFFDSLDTAKSCVKIAAGVMETLTPVPEKMISGLSADMLATDLADYLVRRGVPFRETHHVAGAAVALADSKRVPLTRLSFADLQSLHPKFDDPSVCEQVFNFEASVESRDADGSTSRRSVLQQCADMEAWLKTV